MKPTFILLSKVGLGGAGGLIGLIIIVIVCFYLWIKPKSVIRPTFQSISSFSGLFMPYQHFFRHLVHITVSP